MADIQSGRSSVAGTGPTWFERFVRRSGLTLMVWSAKQTARREAARDLRSADPERKAGILDPSAPEAVRKFGFPPGMFR